MTSLDQYEVWFVTGSQHLYGDDVLSQVGGHSETIARALDASADIPVRVTLKPVVTSADAIENVLVEANLAPSCIGVVAWMHTFSPAKMWIAGLLALRKPLLHLHTQFNRDLPWADIDMDFMNLNQSAHGDREMAFMLTRLQVARTTVVGHWEDPAVTGRVGTWVRAACAWQETRRLRLARFGDNMRQVAVTEGDKVEAQVRLGVSVNGFGVSDLAAALDDVSDSAVDELVAAYDDAYEMAPELRRDGDRRPALRDAARIEGALRTFLTDGGFHAFTDTFEDLGGLPQLPGIAVQRLMADGFGFGAEGDWKTAVLVRALKVMTSGLGGGASFMEDYTYHLGDPEPLVLGAHMLEVCPSLTGDRPSCEIHPLSIGGKADPVRLVFTARTGPGIVVGLLDLGTRFRLVANEVDLVEPPEPLPRLPVACAVWKPRPDLATAATAWLHAGGPHHTALGMGLATEAVRDYAEMAGIELVVIDAVTDVPGFKQELRWNQAYHHLADGP